MTDTHALPDTAMEDICSDTERMTEGGTQVLTCLGGEIELALPSINGIHLFMIVFDNGRVEPSARISNEAQYASAVTDGLVSQC